MAVKNGLGREPARAGRASGAPRIDDSAPGDERRARTIRETNTRRAMEAFFADPENARLLRVAEADELPSEEIVVAPNGRPSPSSADVKETATRIRAEY